MFLLSRTHVPRSPPGPPSPTASPAAPALWFPLPEPRVLSSALPQAAPRRGRPASAPRAPQDCSCWSCPPTAYSFPPPLPHCPLGPSAADTPVSSWHLDHARYTVHSGNQKGDPVTTVPARDSSARAPREGPPPPRGAGGAGPHPRLTSWAARPSTVLLSLSGSPEACPGSQALACKGPGAMAIQEDAGVSRGTSCQPCPAGHQAGMADCESLVCRRDTGCGSPVFCLQQARCPGGQRAAQGPQGPCGLTLSMQSKQAPPASKMGGRAGGGGQKGPRAQCVARVNTPERPQRQAGPSSPCAWGSAPAPLEPDSFRVPPLHTAPPPCHHPIKWGPPPPSFCRKRTRAPSVEVTSPRRPE